ncbi:hypothetical protein RFI_26483, partial [Reticulomyxa filosa]
VIVFLISLYPMIISSIDITLCSSLISNWKQFRLILKRNIENWMKSIDLIGQSSRILDQICKIIRRASSASKRCGVEDDKVAISELNGDFIGVSDIHQNDITKEEVIEAMRHLFPYKAQGLITSIIKNGGNAMIESYWD